MRETFFDELKRYVGFSAADSAILAGLVPLVEPEFGDIVERFYATLLGHEDASRVFTEGDVQVRRLKGTLTEWLGLVFRGPHDEAYFERRWRIGKVHVRIRLPEKYVFGGMIVIVNGILDVLERSSLDPDRKAAARRSVQRILGLELAIITESFRTDYVEQLRRQGRLAVIGQLAASVNHEIRNPLGVINTSVYAMRKLLEKPGTAVEGLTRHLDKIDRSLERSHKIVNDLLDFARGRPPEKKPVDVRRLLDEVVQIAAVPQDVCVTMRVAEGFPPLEADATQITQVMLNLVENAIQAMDGSGQLTLGAEVDGDSYVALSVTDTGSGIPPDALAAVFEPLYTTKAKGTGLGLSVARNIVEAHGGRLEVKSRVGEGSTFTVKLPGGATR